MADPTLKKTNIKFGYTASDGYRMTFDAKAGTGSKNLRTGDEVPPESALLEAFEELTRIVTLFGFGDEAKRRFTEAQQRVADFRAGRPPTYGVMACATCKGNGGLFGSACPDCNGTGGVGACDKAPAGWWCSRPAGHAGRCAAYPTGGTVDQSPRDPRDEEEQRAARTEGR